MKNLILILWFVLFLSSSALAGVEYVTEEVCHAMSGCWMDTKTGECPDCVIEKREVVHTHEETPVIVEKPVIAEKSVVVKETPKIKIVVSKPVVVNTKSSKKMCFFADLGMPDLETGKPVGRYRECNWKTRGSRTAEAVKRGIKECGGLMKWKWTDEHHSEFVCSG